MFSFSKKAHGFYVEINEQAALMARTSSVDAPMVVEELKEVPVGDAAALERAVKELVGKKSASAYMHSRCSVYPPHRLVRRVTLD
ncbi:MAG TPA: hypothetical protein VMD31_14840, partial [Opitutaceae bacterium]|nr:hypothetical protein [Opitutaceae bacterium]